MEKDVTVLFAVNKQDSKNFICKLRTWGSFTEK